MSAFIHESAYIEPNVELSSEGVKVWHHVQIRSGAQIKAFVSLGKGVYVDAGVKIGRGTRIQNGVSVYQGVDLGSWCFVGPHVVFTNDMYPRAGSKTWTQVPTKIENGASIGAGSIIRCGVELGAFCMIGAGSVVTKSVDPFTLVLGTPARQVSLICSCGQTKVVDVDSPRDFIRPCCESVLSLEILQLATDEAQAHFTAIQEKRAHSVVF